MTRIPPSHLDLLDRALPTVLTTEMPDGRFQSTVVWCNRDGEDVLLNTMREFQKARNLRARPRATVLVVDPDANRWVEVRGVVSPESEGAQEHLDQLARLYTGRSEYFGQVVDASLGAIEHPIKSRLRPVRVVTGPVDLLGRGSRSGPLPPLVSAPEGCGEEARIPQTHRGLLERPVVAAMSTRSPSGFAQTQAVWCEPDGNDVLVSTTRERQRGRSLEADPRVTLLVIDPGDSTRWIEIRADVTVSTDGAVDLADRLARQYTSHRRFYGGVHPLEQRTRETRVIARLHRDGSTSTRSTVDVLWIDQTAIPLEVGRQATGQSSSAEQSASPPILGTVSSSRSEVAPSAGSSATD